LLNFFLYSSKIWRKGIEKPTSQVNGFRKRNPFYEIMSSLAMGSFLCVHGKIMQPKIYIWDWPFILIKTGSWFCCEPWTDHGAEKAKRRELMPTYLKFLAGMVGEKYMQKNIREMDLNLVTKMLWYTFIYETGANYHGWNQKQLPPCKKSMKPSERKPRKIRNKRAGNSQTQLTMKINKLEGKKRQINPLWHISYDSWYEK